MADSNELRRQAMLIQAQQIQKAKAQENEPGIGMKALDYATRAADYLAGVTRTAVASPFAYKDSPEDKMIVEPQDWKNALQGKAPSSDEYMDRAGIPEGASLSDAVPGIYNESGDGVQFQKHGPLDPTARGTLGFVADTALDPLTYASMGTSAAAKAGVKLSKAEKVARIALNPMESAAEKSGKNIYTSAFKNVDKDLGDGAGKAVGEMLLDEGFMGNMQGARKANLNVRKEAGKGIGATTKAAAEKGITVDPFVATEDAYSLVQELRKSPHPQDKKAADALEEIVTSYANKGQEIPVDVANKWKSDLYKKVPASGFDPINATRIQGQDQVEKSIALGLREQIAKALESGDTELYNRLVEHNKKFGVSESAQKSLKREAKKEITKNGATAVDGMLAGGGIIGAYNDPENAPAYFAALGLKKGVGALNTTRGRTVLGRGLNAIGTKAKGVPDSLMRRGTWELLQEQRRKEENGD